MLRSIRVKSDARFGNPHPPGHVVIGAASVTKLMSYVKGCRMEEHPEARVGKLGFVPSNVQSAGC